MDTRFVVETSDNKKIEGFVCEADPSNPISEYAIILCHPYTLFGGNCCEPLTCLFFSHFSAYGFTTVKFNFRGAGKSTGHLSPKGTGEQEDVKAVVKYVLGLNSAPKKIILIGNSFGSMIVGAVGDAIPEVVSFICVGYPYSYIWFLTLFNTKAMVEKASKSKKMKYFIIGDKDNFTSKKKFLQFMDTNDKETTKYTIVKDVNHFWVNREDELIRNIDEFLKNNVAGLSDIITLESTVKSTVESTVESTVKSTVESTVESTMKSTESNVDKN